MRKVKATKEISSPKNAKQRKTLETEGQGKTKQAVPVRSQAKHPAIKHPADGKRHNQKFNKK